MKHSLQMLAFSSLCAVALGCSAKSDNGSDNDPLSGAGGNSTAGGAGGTAGTASGSYDPTQINIAQLLDAVDTDGDGTPDAVLVDTDGDGTPDSVVKDTNGDGIGDIVIPGTAITPSNAGGAGGAAGGAGGAAGAPAGGTMAGGAGGAAGAAAGGAAGGGSGIDTGPSAGCQAPNPGEPEQQWIENDIMVAEIPPDQAAMFGERRYWVRLPNGYDHTQPYPVVFYGPGCGAGNVEGTPMMGEIADVAIHVFLLQKESCFSTGSYPSPEVPYFAQALDEVQAKYCTEKSKVFVSGYSSGGWLSNVLACALPERIRGIGTAAGGINKSIDDGYGCEGGPAGIFYTGENDTANPADRVDPDTGFQRGVIGARDFLINGNGCDPNASEPWQNTFGADFCEIWKTGCENSPVIYCVGPGDGHGNGAGNFGISNHGFWEFWSSLP